MDSVEWSDTRKYENLRYGVGPGIRDPHCPICKFDFEKDTPTLTHTSSEKKFCQRTFCEDCLRHWIDSSDDPNDRDGPSCPLCRVTLIPFSDIQNFPESDESYSLQRLYVRQAYRWINELEESRALQLREAHGDPAGIDPHDLIRMTQAQDRLLSAGQGLFRIELRYLADTSFWWERGEPPADARPPQRLQRDLSIGNFWIGSQPRNIEFCPRPYFVSSRQWREMRMSFRRLEEVYNQIRSGFLENTGQLSAVSPDLLGAACDLFNELQLILPRGTWSPARALHPIPNFVEMSRYFMEGRWNYMRYTQEHRRHNGSGGYVPINVRFSLLSGTSNHRNVYPFQPPASPLAAQRREVRYYFHRRAYLLEEMSNELLRARGDIAGIDTTRWVDLFELTAFIQREGQGLSKPEMRHLQATHSWVDEGEPPTDYMPADAVLTFVPPKDPWGLEDRLYLAHTPSSHSPFETQLKFGPRPRGWTRERAVRMRIELLELEYTMDQVRKQFDASNRRLDGVDGMLLAGLPPPNKGRTLYNQAERVGGDYQGLYGLLYNMCFDFYEANEWGHIRYKVIRLSNCLDAVRFAERGRLDLDELEEERAAYYLRPVQDRRLERWQYLAQNPESYA